MINFRKKNLVQDMMPKALEYLNKEGHRPNLIPMDQAEAASKVNSKAMVLVSFIKNEEGYYQIELRDKELYNYTQKLVKEGFQMRITKIDRPTKTITAETDHLGVALDIIEVLALKYNLSIVTV